MQSVETERHGQILVVRMNRPERLNALNHEMRTRLAETWTEFRHSNELEVAIFTGTGRAFCAGEDMKESLANKQPGGKRPDLEDPFMTGALEKPVIAAVNGFCVGGGIGLVGNADVIVASDDATFGLPEVERGALGAATHLSRLVPQHLMRRLFFTAATVDAATLHHFGSVHEVVPREELDEAALRVARDIAAKDTRVIRAAKEALNLIDVQRVNSSYRMEQGFTFELNLAGVADEHRDAFAGTAKGKKE